MDYEILVRFLLAALWGGIVGVEREYHSKSAGFRTMIMISIGSCFFTMMSELMGSGSNGSSTQIASTIVTGIGFLGAGVIFRGENRVNGITTAATIWAVAAVGMGIGSGYYFTSAAASVMIIIVLAVLPYTEKLIDKLNQSKVYSIHCHYSAARASTYESILEQLDLKFHFIKGIKEGDELKITWLVNGKKKKHEAFVAAMMTDNTVLRFEY